MKIHFYAYVLSAALFSLPAQGDNKAYYFFDINEFDSATVLEAAAISELNIDLSENFLLKRHTNFEQLDEFEKREKRKGYLASIQKELAVRQALYKSNPGFVFHGTLTLGKYDFDNSVYPFLELYRSTSGAGGRINIKRDSMDDLAWYYDPTRGIDPRATPVGFFFDRSRFHARYEFDWHPVHTNFSIPDVKEAREFLQTFGRRIQAYIVFSLTDISKSVTNKSNTMIFSFQAECMLLVSRSDNAVNIRRFDMQSTETERCNQYQLWRLNGVDPTDLFDEVREEISKSIESGS